MEGIKKQQCPEFPFFGASYPDATCIDGYLWDLDSDDNGSLTIGGEDACPFCNTEKFIEQWEDTDLSKEQILKQIAFLRDKYDSNH